MSEALYTKKRLERYRGPQSDEYNQRIEENYKDLVYLINKISNLEFDLSNSFIAQIKNLLFVTNFIDSLEQRITLLEASSSSLLFSSDDQIVTETFDGTDYEVASVDRCTYHNPYHILTLPQVTSNSMSKIKFINDDGTFGIPSNLELLVVPVSASADNSSAVIDTSNPLDAVSNIPGKVWERNVLTASPDMVNGAQCYLYVRLPSDISAIPDTNCISFTPFPLKSVDILEIAYSTDTSIALGSLGSQWKPLNNTQAYFQVAEAIGNIAPGSWNGDDIVSSGPKKFLFDPKPITALRFKLRQETYFTEGISNVYSYGLSSLDVRYDKFLSTGKCILKLEAPGAATISSIDSVTPQMWNVPEHLVNSCFSYRVIWETSPDSGIYTLTPVPLSERVWLEVTINAMPDGGSPAVNGILVEYS